MNQLRITILFSLLLMAILLVPTSVTITNGYGQDETPAQIDADALGRNTRPTEHSTKISQPGLAVATMTSQRINMYW